MNKKTFKKLSLCTETLRNLNEQDLQHAAGGSLGATNCTGCETGTRVCSGCAPCA
jgi:hypothetical protein